MFRDGPVKIGRDREFTQCDADVVGVKGQLIEAELLSLYVEVFNRLNIDIVIKYNSRNLMNGLILESGVPDDFLSSVTTIIDKMDKLPIKKINMLLKEMGLTDNSIGLLNKYFDMNFETIKKEFYNTNNKSIVVGIEELDSLYNYLCGIGIIDKCELSLSLARGQNYYTGNVFEVYERTGKLTCSIGAGGRYDKIIGNFINDGNTYEAVGISFGLSSIYELLKEREMFNNKSYIDFYIISINTKMESLKLANEIRKQGYKVELEMSDKRLKKCLEYASKEKIPYVIIYGEDEKEKELVNIKDMNLKKSILISNKDIGNMKRALSSV